MVLVPRSIPSTAVSTRALTLPAIDGYPLAVTCYEPHSWIDGTLLIHSAMAVPQGFYRAFAEHVAAAGYRVITYDYRGIGGSRPASLRGFDATAADWAYLDAAAIAEHARRTYPGPLVSLGHSFGGQLIGITYAAHDVDAAILIGAQLGNYRHWPARERPYLAVMWYAVLPAITHLLGYLPGHLGFGGIDLPAGVALEWARWCRSPGYLVDHIDRAAERFAAFPAPTLVYSFSDDWYAPEPSVAALLARFQRAPLRHRRLAPADVGLDGIGHFGFFRKDAAQSLWREVVEHLGRVAAGQPSELGAPVAPRALAAPSSDSWNITEQELLADLQYGRPSSC